MHGVFEIRKQNVGIETWHTIIGDNKSKQMLSLLSSSALYLDL